MGQLQFSRKFIYLIQKMSEIHRELTWQRHASQNGAFHSFSCEFARVEHHDVTPADYRHMSQIYPGGNFFSPSPMMTRIPWPCHH